jgi:prophage tail gpP-like protein
MDYTDGGPRLVFGRPVAGGGTSYSLTSKKDGQGNNVLDGCYTEDMSRRYSEVTAIGQYNSTAQKHVIALKKDGTFPFFKPFVTHLRNGSQTPMLYARLVIEKMRHEGVQLVYRVPGHSQDGKNWRINELCDVNDERFTLHSPYLIFGRTFERSMSGTTTVLRLGPMGMIV